MASFTGLFLFAFTLVACISMGPDSLIFLNLPSLFVCLLITAGMTLLRHGFSVFQSEYYQANSVSVLRTIGWAAIHAGWMGTLIAIIQISQSMEGMRADNWVSVGPSLAVTLLTVFYGYGVWMICEALAQRNEMQMKRSSI